MTENTFSVKQSKKKMGKARDTNEIANPEREQRILEAAGRLSLRYGFDKTTVDDIAREAGISKGAIYLHYASKDDLLEALIWHEAWVFLQAYLERMEADPMGGTIIGMFRHSLAVMYEQPIVRALYSRDVQIIGNFMRRRIPAIFANKSLMRREMIAAMQHMGLVRKEIDADSVAYILDAFTQGFLILDSSADGTPAPPYERMLETLSDMLGPYLTPEGLTNTEAGKALIRQAVVAYRQMEQERKGIKS